MKIIRLATFENSIKANIFKGRLESEGIPCFLTNENFTTMLPLTNYMLGAGVQVMVNQKDYVAAKRILSENEKVYMEKDLCPNCGSKALKYGIGYKKSFFVIFSLILGMAFNYINNSYRCTNCGAEF